jgi:hypothetical protein
MIFGCHKLSIALRVLKHFTTYEGKCSPSCDFSLFCKIIVTSLGQMGFWRNMYFKTPPKEVLFKNQKTIIPARHPL